MQTRRLPDCCVLLVLVVVTACSTDSAAGVGAPRVDALDSVEPYRWTCVETTCELRERTCEEEQARRCEDCYDLCLQPGVDAASCASTCRSVCTRSCASCSAPIDECASMGVVFDPPQVNAELYREAAAYISECEPDYGDPDALAEFYGRSRRHEYTEILRCFRMNACRAPLECNDIVGTGSVGDAICGRQAQCGVRCDDLVDDDQVVASVLNLMEPSLRPQLVDQLFRCAAEPTCDVATSCWVALKPAVYLARYP